MEKIGITYLGGCMEKVGIVGLGAMGKHMAVNLTAKLKDVMVFDIRPEACNAAVKAGATRAQKLEDMAVCDQILIMVNTGDQVNDVLKTLSKHIDPKRELAVAVTATVSRKQIRDIAHRYNANGIEVVDAPVSGGPILAELAALSIIIGGTENQVEKLRPVLEAVGRVIFHVGEVGQGAAMKLVNNVLGICNMVLTPAALKIGLEAGLNLKQMVEVINASGGKNLLTEVWEAALMSLNTMYGTPDARAIQLKVNEKDIRAYLELANEVGMKTGVGEAVLNMVTSDDQLDKVGLDRFQVEMTK